MSYENKPPFENKLLVFGVRFLRIFIGIIFIFFGLSAITHMEMIDIINDVPEKNAYHWLLYASTIGLFLLIIPFLKMGWRKIKDTSTPFSEKSFIAPKLQLLGTILGLRAVEVFAMSQFNLPSEETTRYIGIFFAIIFMFLLVFVYTLVVNRLHRRYLKLQHEYEDRKQSDVFVEKP